MLSKVSDESEGVTSKAQSPYSMEFKISDLVLNLNFVDRLLKISEKVESEDGWDKLKLIKSRSIIGTRLVLLGR